MSLPIRFLPAARGEFDESAARYEAQRDGLGLDFIARVDTVLERIAANPRLYAIEKGQRSEGPGRSLPLRDPLAVRTPE